jgi:phospholipid transport system substrate-binding protein
MLKRLLLTLVAGLTLAFTMMSYAGSTPTDDVRASVDAMLEILQNEQLCKEDKRAQMSTVINKRFDFRAMSQRTLATNWKKTTDEEKQQFVALFSQLIENSYVGKIEAYTDEKVEYPGEKVKGRKAVVETLIITSSADVPVNYKVYQKGDQWLVYDVIIEGVSLISNYRSSYQEIMKKEGFDGLIAKMQAKIDELTSTPS